MGWPGVESVPTPCGIILNSFPASQLPYSAKIKNTDFQPNYQKIPLKNKKSCLSSGAGIENPPPGVENPLQGSKIPPHGWDLLKDSWGMENQALHTYLTGGLYPGSIRASLSGHPGRKTYSGRDGLSRSGYKPAGGGGCRASN